MKSVNETISAVKYSNHQFKISHRHSRPHSHRIILATILSVLTSLLLLSSYPVKAAAKNDNDSIYATIQYVQDAINTALSPIQNAIANLQQQQSNQSTQINNQQNTLTNLQNTQATHTSQISDLQTQQTNQGTAITNLQSSTGKQLQAYDANGNYLGLATGGVGGSGAGIYSPSLSEFIYIATNSYAEIPSNNQGFLTSGLMPLVSRIFYKSSDCTGTAYGPTDYGFPTNQVLAFSPTENYTYHSSDTIITATMLSFRVSNQPTTCHPGIAAFTGWQLYPVTLPFPTPIAEPVQFKYQ